ncbi:MAG: hypothetical protein AAGD96_22975 [Chloroflexota bacterium]
MISLIHQDVMRMYHYFGGGSAAIFRILVSRCFWAVFVTRLTTNKLPVVGFFVRFVSSIILANVYKIEVASRTRIEGGLMFPHPNDIIIGAISLGRNCTILNSTTLGASVPDPGFDLTLRPEVGDNVTIGAGARVLGGIRLDNGVTVGANAVVLEDVAAMITVAGVPAKPIH